MKQNEAIQLAANLFSARHQPFGEETLKGWIQPGEPLSQIGHLFEERKWNWKRFVARTRTETERQARLCAAPTTTPDATAKRAAQFRSLVQGCGELDALVHKDLPDEICSVLYNLALNNTGAGWTAIEANGKLKRLAGMSKEQILAAFDVAQTSGTLDRARSEGRLTAA